MAKSIPWDLVTDSEFEKLAFFLLSEEDFYNLQWFGRGGGDKGRDLVGFTYEEPITGQRHEKKWVIQCKHYTKPLNKSVLKEDLAKAEQHNPDYWLLFTNLSLTSDDLDWLDSMDDKYSFKIMIWHEPDLVQLLNKHQEIRRDFFSISIDETYIIKKIRESPFRNFERDLRDWLNVLDYAFESIRYENDRFEFIINVPMRRGYDRILVVGIEGAIVQSQVAEATERSEKLRTDEAWLVSPRLVMPAARKEAEKGRVFVYNFDELIDEQADFDKYFKWLEDEITKKQVNDYYVDLACNVPELDKESKKIGESLWDKIDKYLNIWLDDPNKEHISLLGEFGAGKTWFCLHYTYKKVKDYLKAKEEGIQRPRLPLFIPLRDYAKAVSVESLFSEFIFKKHEIGLPSYRAFELLNRMGKFVLIFDGFDEMARKVDYQTVVNNFWELAKVVAPGSKAILTCRTEHFRYSQESRDILSAKVKASTSNIVLEPPHFTVAYIEKLNDEQIKEIIIKRREKDIGKETAEDIAKKIRKHPTISDLARRPVLIEFILDSFPEIEKLKDIDLTKVVYFSCKKKLEKDIKEERTFTSMADKVYFMCELAWEMLSKNELKLHYKLFPERIKTYFPEAIKEEELDHWHFDMLQQTLLIRDADGNYQFAHKSLAEFFVAYKFASELGILADEFLEMARERICDKNQRQSIMTWSEFFKKASETCPPLGGFNIEKLEKLKTTFGTNTLSPEIKQFLAGLVDNRKRKEIIKFISTLKGEKFDEVRFVGSNILTLMNECGEFRQGKRGNFDFSDLVLRHVDLYGADLKGCSFNSSDLSNAILHSADLTGANFSGAVLKSANLFSTTLTDANFSKADFTDAKVADVTDVLAAIVDDSKRFVIFIVDDNTARLWDSKTGKELQYFEHKGIVGAIWSNDGKKFLTWNLSGILKVWNVATGKELQSIDCGKVSVGDVIWSKDEKKILTIGPSGLILWDVDTGKIMASIEHKTISGFILSKNERKILTWDLDGLVRLWDLTTEDFEKPPKTPEYNPQVYRGWNGKRGKSKYSTGEELQPIDNEDIEGAVWSKDERKILTWNPSSIRLWDIVSPSNNSKLEEKGRQIELQIQKEAKFLAPKPIVRQPLVIGKIIQSIEGKGNWFIDHIIWSNDEKEILIMDMDGPSIMLFDISKGAKGKKTEFSINQLYDEEDFEEGVRPSPSGVIWSEDGKKIFAWLGKSGIFLDISEKRRAREKEFRSMHRHYWINGACWLKDGEEILTWGNDGTAKIWDAKTGRATKTFMSKINCDGMSISNAKGLNKEKYISLLYKGAIMSISEIKDLKLSLQTHLNIIFD